MIINVPEDIKEEFMHLLDIAQCNARNHPLTRNEKKCIKFVQDLLGDNASSPINDDFNDGKVG